MTATKSIGYPVTLASVRATGHHRFLEVFMKRAYEIEFSVAHDAISLYPRHPFHIHVNPFMHTRTGPDGMPETVWRDTLIVEKGKPASAAVDR
jgi:hypothetical protein